MNIIMNSIVKENLDICRDLGVDGFVRFIKVKLLLLKENESDWPFSYKSDWPFSYPSVYTFEDILDAIYHFAEDKEKTNMRWALSSAAKDWELNKHGFEVLRKLYKWGAIVESKGVFSETIDKIKNWKPAAKDYINIIKFGKIAHELWQAKIRLKVKEISDTHFFTIARHFKDMLVQDKEGHFKLIYAPLFMFACSADLNDWPRMASIVVERYPYNKEKDPWPEEYAGFELRGKKGFFNLQTTLKTVLQLVSHEDTYILKRGCKMLLEDYQYGGGSNCFLEIFEALDIVRLAYENERENKYKIVLSTTPCSPEWRHGGDKIRQTNEISVKIPNELIRYFRISKTKKDDVLTRLNTMQSCFVR